MNIPFNKLFLSGKEIQYISDTIASRHLCGDGNYTKKCHAWLEKHIGCHKALLTPSCTAALELAAILTEIGSGDEVILPSYTFVSTANAILLRGAKPVFADIVDSTLNIDPQDIKRKITNKTKAIFPVHYAGVACDMDSVMQIASDSGLIVVEDAAQGVNAQYKGKYLGTIGDIGCYSFHETKNYTCGEGGAILINRNSRLAERAEILREKGTNRSKFIQGTVDKYTWIDIGSSFLPSDIQAAFLYAQFEKLDEIQIKRAEIYRQYYEGLKALKQKGLLRLPVIPPESESNYHMFYVLLNTEKERNILMSRLKENGINAVFHYIPLHISPMGCKLGYRTGDLPKTENLSSRLLRLPMYADLSNSEIDYVLSNIHQILTNCC
jgi:dTDP-4-amino-4,6-dideoxygalactose transaminase